jgi:hypothetical protein
MDAADHAGLLGGAIAVIEVGIGTSLFVGEAIAAEGGAGQ